MIESMNPYYDVNANPDSPNYRGIYRVKPGSLSVARTIGDIEAKQPRFGGKQNVIISVPDVSTLKIMDNFDFLIIGCNLPLSL